MPQPRALGGSINPDGQVDGTQLEAVWDLDPTLAIPIIHLRGGAIGPSPTWREATDWAKANVRGAYRNLTTDWTVTVGANGIHEGIHRLAAAGVPEAITAIPDLIALAIPIDTGPDLKRRKHVYRVHRLIGALSTRGKSYRALMTLLDTRDGLGYHGHQIEALGMERPGDLGEGTGGLGPLSESHPPGTISLGQLFTGFKLHTGGRKP